MPSEPQLDPPEAAHFLMIGVITAIDPRKDTFHVGRTEIVAEKRHLAGASWSGCASRSSASNGTAGESPAA